MGEGKLEDCEKTLNSILPTVNRVEFRKFELHQMLSVLKFKQGKFKDSIALVKQTLEMKPEDPTLLKLLIIAEHKIDSSDLVNDCINALKNCKQTEIIVQTISEFIRDLDKEDLDKEFIESLQTLPDEKAANFIKAIPETDETLQYRVKLLKLCPPTDVDKLEDLAYALKDMGEYDESLKYAQMLPEDNNERLFIETLFGDNPIDTAKKHINKGKNQFENWIKSLQNPDPNEILKEVKLIPDFRSGYIMVIDLINDRNVKNALIDEITKKFSKSLKALESAAKAKEELNDYEGFLSISNMIVSINEEIGQKYVVRALIKLNRLEEAQKLIDNGVELSLIEKAKFAVEFWKTDKDDNRLHELLKYPYTKEFAEIKSMAAFYLGNHISAETANDIFTNCLKADRENCNVYAYFGNYLITVLNEQEKGKFLLKKSYDLGYRGSECLEIIVDECISSNQYEEAIKHCQLVNESWARFKSGLLYFKLGKYEDASYQLQLYTKRNPDDFNALTVLGYTYMSMGRLVAVSQIAEELEKIGHPCKELQYKVDCIYGKKLSENIIDQETVHNPLLFGPSLYQTMELMKRLFNFNRYESIIEVIHQTENLVSSHVLEFGEKLSSVLKSAAEYYLLAFKVTKEGKYANECLKLFMRRAEKDKRGECFIDVAEVLSLLGKTEQSIIVLRRAVKAFPDNAYVWKSLGIAFFMTGKISFSRHCFCVAAKLSDETEKANVLNCYAALSYFTNDNEMMSRASEEANTLDPKNASSWEHKSICGTIDPYHGQVLSFTHGNQKYSIETLTELAINANKPFESLGYAFMTRDKTKICLALEACGKYKDAFEFTEDEETKERLKFLLEENDKENVKHSTRFNELISGIEEASKANEIEKKEEILNGLYSNTDRNFKELIDQLRYHINLDSLQPENCFGYTRDLTKQSDAKNAAVETFNQYKDYYNPLVIKNYIIQVLKTNDTYEIIAPWSEILLKMDASRDNILLQALTMIFTKDNQSAAKYLQQYITLKPQMYKKILPLIRKLNNQ
ncbi:TPR Domain containing protein [Trichomonas vaginalis G3]|uniref:TPR Domain containing protein n=1 Tax=Trichomonas vaginalis (strain ATCC PRA-98 / G3) TaxID=412133 RepID=A2FHQ1_TRIV3|nr:cellulose synthase operon protein C family [Trichomonas vaginalis G3]EAX95551.1 TPR Domain containing protein [Trichomonas vaginalis G3]KAI5520765.1 cellulose synthase operon protein C family [Trichomonas vaginalis G3]|eukprot:XP_001308481.1 TPR Domain containing protein [Trichomonas vaginalis G3]